jgi:hypothetical protein
MDLTSVNCSEPVISLNSFQYSSINGNGILDSNGYTDVSTWNVTPIYVDQYGYSWNVGFRYVRSAE